ncbi:RicAFT regulatory complex protein RicA family protein [Kurthia sp. Dielmo]|uniref:RicAFT regulatory complex protein RicA family protein n=1 Tax=Kurthia sp. Dielmo TaxID=1033738 RepID=UPI0002DA68D5|nr:YlbF family regulator [Kurthia sp. Dielmo]
MPERFSNEDIKRKAQQIAAQIEQSEEVAFFKRAEAQLNNNKKVQQKIAEIKLLQKQAVNLQHYGKYVAQHEVEAKIDALQQEIDDMPIVDQFKGVHKDVNELLQLVAKTMADHLEK